MTPRLLENLPSPPKFCQFIMIFCGGEGPGVGLIGTEAEQLQFK